jgi:hypothetical protein
MIPTTTKQVPRLVFFVPVADPSYCQNTPCTFLPLRRLTLSSIATGSRASSFEQEKHLERHIGDTDAGAVREVFNVVRIMVIIVPSKSFGMKRT